MGVHSKKYRQVQMNARDYKIKILRRRKVMRVICLCQHVLLLLLFLSTTGLLMNCTKCVDRSKMILENSMQVRRARHKKITLGIILLLILKLVYETNINNFIEINIFLIIDTP
jgi:hypothetical protein